MRSAAVLVLLFAQSALAANRPPAISGAPPPADAGEPFVFQLAASDPDGDAVSFRVGSRPSWLSLDIYTGKLSGTPTAADVGASTITVVANDGRGGVSSQSMRIVVRAAKAAARTGKGTGRAELSWKAPTRNTDGSPAAIRGYRIRYGKSEWALSDSIDVPASVQRYVVERLEPGTYYFGVQALSARGESQLSEIVKKVVK